MGEKNDKLFYTPDEFRKFLRCSRHLLYESLLQGKIRSFKLGKRYFIPASELNRLSQVGTVENENSTQSNSYPW